MSKQAKQTSIKAAAPAERRVLILVENLPVPFDRRVWEEATALMKAGYTVSVICPKGKGHDSPHETINGIHIYRHNLPFEAQGALGYLLEYSTALFWQLILSFKVRRQHGVDVIQACNPPDLMFLIAAIHKLLFGTRFIFDHHDLAPELFEVKFGKKGFLHKVMLACERATFRLADASIATNETFRDIAIRRGGMSPDRVKIVRSYPDLERFRRVDPEPGLKKDFKHLVGYVGIMGNQDGIDLLVKAMSILVHEKKRTDIGCLIIGDGPELENLEAQASAEKLDNVVEFAGYVSGNPLLAKLSALDIGVIPDPSNAFNDNLSMNKVFEYMALGLPFVQFNLQQSAREAGEAAMILPHSTAECLADGILELLADPERRQKMSAYGLQKAQRDFQWESQVPHLLDAYRTALSPR
jgi:glycosyltransferase involved in cell wall biosynthesis